MTEKIIAFKEVCIPTKKVVLVTATILTFSIIIISILLSYLWLGLLLSVLINYIYIREYYPSVSVARAKKIINTIKVSQSKKEKIPCSANFIKIMSRKNRHLHHQNKCFCWFLSTNQELSANNIRSFKIKDAECYFYLQKYHSAELYQGYKDRL